MPASLAGAGKPAEKCSGQSDKNKNPRAPGDFPSIIPDSLREASEAQTWSGSVKTPGKAAPKPQSQLKVFLPFESEFEGKA